MPRTERDAFAEVLSSAGVDGTLEAVFLLKQTGIALASWTRQSVPQEVVSVMAATLWGSLDTMIRTLGGEAPRSALVEIEDRRILAMTVEPNWTLFLVASKNAGKRRLRREAQQILERVSVVRSAVGARRLVTDLPAGERPAPLGTIERL